MKKPLLIIVIFVLTLAGCSTKLAYNNLDWLVYWYLDDYIELNDSQESVFDSYLSRWIEWHRSSELNRYIQQLEDIKQDVEKDNLNKERVISHFEHASSHWTRMREEISPVLAKMAKTLSDEQVIRLFAALEEDNKEREARFEEMLELDEEEREQKRIEDIAEDVEKRIGPLNDAQLDLIKQYSSLFSSTREEWIAYRRAIQAEARRLFASRHVNPKFETELTQLMLNPESYRSVSYNNTREKNQVHYAELISKIADSLTGKQKRHLIGELDGFASDLKQLTQ